MMEIVYRVVPDDQHQYFLITNKEDRRKLDADCKPKGDGWEPPQVHQYEPLLDAGDFYNFYSDYLIANQRALDMVGDFFRDAGEILPLPYEDEVYWYINVLNCFNCLDVEKTEWRHRKKIGQPERYVFHPGRLPEPGIFKIPETHTGETLVLVDTESPETSFIREVERSGLKGLTFEELWRNE